MKILGIETSCDETAAAVVEDGHKLLSNVVASSVDLQRVYGGVVPEIAARSHIESINPVIRQALNQASCSWADIDAVAVTYGPGLGGSLLIGVLSARTLAILHHKPLFAINHVQAHVYSCFITSSSPKLAKDYILPATSPQFPLLALIVSGGHTQLVLFRDHNRYEILGRTLDDAAGEAFDKVAKMLGFPYPGGPSLEKLAQKGDPAAFKLPRARLTNKYDFSYSGLKTAVLRTAQQAISESYDFPSHRLADRLSEGQKADIAASFTQTAIGVLADRTVQAYDEFNPKSVVISGGVSASPELRWQLADRLKVKALFADPKLCTDNGAMIAAAGYFQSRSTVPADPLSLDIAPSLAM